MRYNRYLYRLSVQAVLITDIVKNSLSAANIIADPIIHIYTSTIVLKCVSYYIKERLFINSVCSLHEKYIVFNFAYSTFLKP